MIFLNSSTLLPKIFLNSYAENRAAKPLFLDSIFDALKKRVLECFKWQADQKKASPIKSSNLGATDLKILETGKANLAKLKQLAARGELFQKPPKPEPLRFSRFPAMQGLPYIDCLVFPNGDVYKGEIVNEVPLGPGTMFYYGSGTICEGYFAHGKVEGKGRLLFRSGLSYEGAFINGMLHGEGKLFYHGECVYEGQFYENTFPQTTS